MAHPISRLYANKADADAALEDLRKHGFQPEELFVVEPPAGSAVASEAAVGAIAERIAKGFILKRHAEIYARRVAGGAVFVTVHAPFGAGRKATTLLDRHNPVESGVEAPAKRPARKYDEAAPLSSTLLLPVLVRNPTPFGAVSGLPSLSGSPPRLIEEPAPLSATMGWPTQSANPTPVATVSRAPTLAPSNSLFSNWIGMGTLWNSAAPLSRALFLPVLSRSGAPLSLGLPLLWR